MSSATSADNSLAGNANRLISPNLLVGIGMLLAMLAYYPGLDGEFMFDDHANILDNPALHIESLTLSNLTDVAQSGTSGPLKRPVATLTFAFNYYVDGLSPWSWKLTNLLIHLLAGWTLFLFCCELLRAQDHPGSQDPRRLEWVAATVACLWLLHPLNLTSVLYVVQRMTSLSALFTLLALWLYIKGRSQMNRGGGGWPRIFAALFLATPLAALSKETGALAPLFMLLIELSIFRFAAPAPQRGRLLLLFAVTVILPVLLALAYVLINPGYVLGGYRARPFTLTERLLTESRVLGLYAQMVFLPRLQSLGLFLDDVVLSTGLLRPPMTLAAIALWAGLLVFSLSRLCPPMLRFGLLFFLLGHCLESGVFALELAFEHRNYLPMVGLLLPPVYYLLYHGIPGLADRLPAVLLVIFGTWLMLTTSMRAASWSSLEAFSVAQYRHHPRSARSNYQMGRLYATLVDNVDDPQLKQQHLLTAAQYFGQSAELREYFTDGLFGLVVLYSRNGVALPPGLVAELERRLRDEPFTNNNVNQLLNLRKCYNDGACRLSPELLNGVFAAAMENRGLPASQRSLLQR